MNREKIVEILRKKAQELDPFIEKIELKNPDFVIPQNLSNEDWVKCVYDNILKQPQDSGGISYWISKLAEGMQRQQIEQHIRQVAFDHNQKHGQKSFQFEDLLDKDDKERVLIVIPESSGDVFLTTSLFESLKRRYPNASLYIATKPEYRDIIVGNPHVHRWIPYSPMMDNITWLEGNSQHKGFFDIAYLPYFNTQKLINYYHSGRDKIDFEIKN